MSYILDALKKSDRERQQGTSPTLYAIHGSGPPGRDSSAFRRHLIVWLFSGILIFVLAGLGFVYLLSRQHIAKPPSASESQPLQSPPPERTASRMPQEDTTSLPQVIIKENNQVLRSIPVDETPPDPPTVVQPETSRTFLPLLEELSPEVQAKIPSLKFAGHTYSAEPSQRMIIINGRILREGDMITPDTRLTEITWEGVIMTCSGIRFRVITK